MRTSRLPVEPPVEPMLAKLADELPVGDYLYEPKWDGFRAIVFRSENDVYVQSRDMRPLDRYFPELHAILLERLPSNIVIDGEIVIATARGLDFDALQLRLHPAASRVEKLAKETPSSFIAFDVLAVGARNLMTEPQATRRAALEELLDKVQRRRQLPTRVIQAFQKTAQDRIIGRLLERTEPITRAPLIVRLFDRFAILRRIPGRFLGLGVRRERVRSPAAARRP